MSHRAWLRPILGWLLVATLLMAVLASSVRADAAAPLLATPPRLTVLIVVDQMRGDEFIDYAPLWRHGFHKLRTEGRWYARAMHGHARTITAVGHATLGTGVYPRWHGVVNQTIALQESPVTQDVCRFSVEPCDPTEVLLQPTMGDRLKSAAAGAQVAALAQKGWAASFLAGQSADLVAWYADGAPGLEGRVKGKWGLPYWIQSFWQQRVSRERLAQPWELPPLPEPFASRPDAGDGEGRCGYSVTFPHTVPAPAQASIAELYGAWRCTPDADTALNELALETVRHLGLGSDDTPDLLLVSFGTNDRVGHHHGYESLERVALLSALDAQLGQLLEELRRRVGPRLLVALTSDHGLAPRLSMARAQGHKAGTVALAELSQLIDAALTQRYGPSPDKRGYVRAITFPFITLQHIPYGRNNRGAQLLAAEAVAKHPAVYGAWPVSALDSTRSAAAGLLAANAHPHRSGDIAVALNPYFRFEGSAIGADHGSPCDYDRHVPLVLWGDQVTGGRIEDEVEVIDLIRTLGDRLGLQPVKVGGKPLP